MTLLKDTDNSKHLLFSTKSKVTVFVPTNKAFEKLGKDRHAALFDPANKHWLERVLAYHAVHGDSIDRYILTRVGLVKNGVGQNLKLTGTAADDLRIDGIRIVESDFTCSNGVVHFIDEVINPVELDLFESIEEDGRFTVLSKLLKRSGLTKLLQTFHVIDRPLLPKRDSIRVTLEKKGNYGTFLKLMQIAGRRDTLDQFTTTVTIFAPTDEAFRREGLADRMESLSSTGAAELLRGLLGRHVVDSRRILLPNAIAFQRFDSNLKQRLDIRRNGDQRSIQGIPIVETDIIAANGIVHGIDGVIAGDMEAIDSDQNWQSIRTYILNTLKEGSRLYTEGHVQEATDYYESRNFEFRARYGTNLKRFYGVDVDSSLPKDLTRNRHYEFASTAWGQRNGFRNLLRELEKSRALLIDEHGMMMPLGQK